MRNLIGAIHIKAMESNKTLCSKNITEWRRRVKKSPCIVSEKSVSVIPNPKLWCKTCVKRFRKRKENQKGGV